MVHGLETIVRLNEEATKSSCLSVVVAMDDETLFQAMYVDGVRTQQDETIYASDMEFEAKGRPFVLKCINVALPLGEDFPRRLDECMKFVVDA